MFVPRQALDVTAIRMEFAGFSTNANISNNTTVFGNGTVTSFQVNGLDTCEARALDRDHDYESDTGPMTSLVVCSSGSSTVKGPLTITWSISYH